MNASVIPSPAFQSQATLRPLSFDPAKLKGLSERLIRSHWENNYGGSVKALANVKARLEQAVSDKDLPPYIYNDLKREHLVRTGSVVLHELYFDNLGGDGNAGADERRALGRRLARSMRGNLNFGASAPGSRADRAGSCSASTCTRTGWKTIGWPITHMVRQRPCRCS
jgi:superoxide dismutase